MQKLGMTVHFLFLNTVFNFSFLLSVINSHPGKSNGEAPGPEPIRATGSPGQPGQGGVYGSGV